MVTYEVGVASVSENPLAYAGPSHALLPILAANREPTTSDLNYRYGQMWFNTSDGAFWIRTNSSAVWSNLAPGGSGAATVPDGGTGRTTLTDHAVLVGSGVDPIDFVGPAATGTVLQGAGAAADPAFSTATYPATTAQGDLLLSASANAITALSKDTNATRYLANTGASNNAQWDQVNLANGVTGILSITNGGTGVSGVEGTTQTVGAVSSDIITYDLGATNGVYVLKGLATGIVDTTGANASGYTFEATYRTTGAAATLIDSGDNTMEDVALGAAKVVLTASGNNAVISVTGVAGQTINWKANFFFIFQAAV